MLISHLIRNRSGRKKAKEKNHFFIVGTAVFANIHVRHDHREQHAAADGTIHGAFPAEVQYYNLLFSAAFRQSTILPFVCDRRSAEYTQSAKCGVKGSIIELTS